jgi:hypothetical protein
MTDPTLVDELQMTFDILDYRSGVRVGYSSKILGPTPVKHFGPRRQSFFHHDRVARIVHAEHHRRAGSVANHLPVQRHDA